MNNSIVSMVSAKSILSKASGYIGAFDYTLNPYKGCTFACDYCYAAFFAESAHRMETWGSWVEAKENAVSLLSRFGKRITGKSIYMSSVTDPYQPIELKLRLTRRLLESMVSYQPNLVIQTRSPLVLRDLDILLKFAVLRINMTVTTDEENVRKEFEPQCPSIQRRLEAIEEIKAAGIKTGICLTPLLPVRDPDSFGNRLRSANADVYVVQAFQTGSARFAAGTRPRAWQLAENHGWNLQAYERVKSRLREYVPELHEGREGFMPERQPPVY
jgi:DNA repair photolyase